MRRTWNYESCKEEAKKYRGRAEWSVKSRPSYMKSKKNNWIDDFFPPRKSNWDKNKLIEFAKKCKTRSSFNWVAWSAKKFGIYDECIMIVDSNKTQNTTFEWTKEAVLEFAKNCRNRNDFHLSYAKYQSRRLGIYDQCLLLLPKSVQGKRNKFKTKG